MAGLLALGNPGALGTPLRQVDHGSRAHALHTGAAHGANSDWSRWMVALGLR